MSLTDEIRAAAARVVARARYVQIVDGAIGPYARTLPAGTTTPPAAPDDLELAAAVSLTLNTINFGSGWFPTLRKPAGQSGFRTVEAGVRAHGPWTRGELRRMDARRIAAVLGQDPGHELMELYATALRELGERVGGSFAALARAGGGSAVRLAEHLAAWPGWRDVSSHAGEAVPLFKRAQIAAFDLHLQGVAPADDLAQLTLFADNLVPHVLRLDGVLRFDPELVARIERAELLEHGAPEEVEIRAVAVHAVELLVAAHGRTTAAAIDQALWSRGAEPHYKAHARHRSRTTAY